MSTRGTGAREDPLSDEAPRRSQYAYPNFTCSWCRGTKPPDDFFTKKNARGLDGVCKACRALESGDEGPLDDAAVQRFCKRKDRYGSEAFATEVAMRALRKGKIAGLRAYPCPACDGWHITGRTDIGSAPRVVQLVAPRGEPSESSQSANGQSEAARRRAERRERRRAAKAAGVDGPEALAPERD